MKRAMSSRILTISMLTRIAVAGAVCFLPRESAASPTAASLVSAVIGQQSIPAETVVGRETCAKCHGAELNAWQASAHGQKSWALLSDPKAQDFAKKLGIAVSEIHTSTLCTSCHGSLK